MWLSLHYHLLIILNMLLPLFEIEEYFMTEISDRMVGYGMMVIGFACLILILNGVI